MTQDETRAANKKKNGPVLILFFYLVKKIQPLENPQGVDRELFVIKNLKHLMVQGRHWLDTKEY